MADTTGETDKPVRVAFDRLIKLRFHGARSPVTAACSPIASWTTRLG
jgi:hypothetical protein